MYYVKKWQKCRHNDQFFVNNAPSCQNIMVDKLCFSAVEESFTSRPTKHHMPSRCSYIDISLATNQLQLHSWSQCWQLRCHIHCQGSVHLWYLHTPQLEILTLSLNTQLLQNRYQPLKKNSTYMNMIQRTNSPLLSLLPNRIICIMVFKHIFVFICLCLRGKGGSV